MHSGSQQPDGQTAVIIPHISIVSAYINDGGQSSSVTGRKTAFIQIDFLDNPGAFVRNGRRGARVINPRTKLVVKTELDYAASRKLAIWDMYHVVGGERYACLNWSNGNYFQRDKIHFTQEGYILQGLLLHEAIIKSYNNYVETQLDGTWN